MSELARLAALPSARIRRIDGVGHFLHAEVLPLEVRELKAGHARRVTSLKLPTR